MARSLSVKIPTASLIADIEKSLAQIDEEIANYPQAVEEYRQNRKAYNDLVIQKTIEAIKDPNNIGEDYDSVVRVQHNRFGNGVDVSIRTDLLGLPEAPKQPEEPNKHQSFGRDWTTRKALLEKNLKVLRMTSQEEVNATTYNTVIDIL